MADHMRPPRATLPPHALATSAAVAVALITAAAASGCGSDARGTEAGAAVRDTLPDGRVVVRWSALPGDEADPVSPDLRIGSVEGDGPDVFGDVRGVAEGPAGAIYVLDFQAAELRGFGPDGTFRRILARRGEGPGELSRPNGMLVGPDGTIWVKDHGSYRIVGFDPGTGEEVARHPTVVQGYGYVWDGAVDREGRFWKPWQHAVDPASRRVWPEPGLQENESRRYYLRYDPRTETRDSIPLGRGTSRSFVAEVAGGRMYAGLPFAAGTELAVDPDGHVWSAWSEDYRIARIDEAGDTVLVIELDAEGPPVTDEDRRSFLERITRGEEGQVANRLEAGLSPHFPERRPVIEGLSVDRPGRLWVRRAPAAGEPVRFDVFDRGGEFLVTLRVDAPLVSHMRPVIGRAHLYGLVRDELDVPYVVRVPLPEALAG